MEIEFIIVSTIFSFPQLSITQGNLSINTPSAVPFLSIHSHSFVTFVSFISSWIPNLSSPPTISPFFFASLLFQPLQQIPISLLSLSFSPSFSSKLSLDRVRFSVKIWGWGRTTTVVRKRKWWRMKLPWPKINGVRWSMRGFRRPRDWLWLVMLLLLKR